MANTNAPFDVLKAIPKSDRGTLLSFISLSSLPDTSPDEALDTICLSLALKYAAQPRKAS